MKHVLIVDDIEESRYLLQALLQGNGYRVSTACNGIEALAAARREPPDVIVSDALMPAMDGFALCRAWMQDAILRHIPFAFYSATYTNPDDDSFALKLGAVRFIVKPQEPEVLLEILSTVLQEAASRPAPVSALLLDNAAFNALHASVLTRKLDHKLAQLEAKNRELRSSEARFRSMAEMSSDFYWESDGEHRITTRTADFKNEGKTEIDFGALIGKRRWELPYLSPGEAGWQKHQAVLDAHQPFRDFEFSRLGAGGRERFFAICGEPVFGDSGAFKGYRGVGTDITQRKLSEQALRAAEGQFRSLVEQTIAGIYIVQDGRFVYANPYLAEMFGYASADHLLGRDVLTLVAEKDRTSVAEHVLQRVEGRAQGANFNFTGKRKDGSLIEVTLNGARTPYRNRPAAIGLVQDITEKKRSEEQIARYLAQIEKSLMSVVGVAMALGEMRDPYTAGHERRVGELAAVIGAELGFDARRSEGLRVIGQLHDIGKTAIPAEILAKPGRLSEIERQFVKLHAQAGYDALKNVEFPWPVAQVAQQHHERMDGSGYPQGLKGEAILLEARIMAVVDVVEAMASHRPYRPGHGIKLALAEIERGSGSVYDPAVAAACLRLFREKGYVFPS